MLITIEENFRLAMANKNILYNGEIVSDGQLHRFHIEQDKPNNKNGWLILHSDGVPAGAFGSWKTGVSATWCSKSKNEMTTSEWQQYCNRIKQANEKRKQIQIESNELAAKKANYLWDKATNADINHPYLIKKKLNPNGLRQLNDQLLVPLMDVKNNIHNLQRIGPDGNKYFLAGGRVKGLYCLIGNFSFAERLYICEGWATAASIHQITNRPAVATMNAGNIKSVAINLRSFLPSHLPLIIAADNDRKTPTNPGLTKGKEAATAVNAYLTWPHFPCDSCNCTDFNDLYNCELRQGINA